MDILLTLIIMVICLISEGFFSGSEIGVVSADKIKLRHDAARGSRGAKLALKMLEKPEWLLSTTLVGTNIAVVTNTTMATALMIQLFGERGSWLAIIIVAPLIWVFGEIVPKSVFQQRVDTITPRAIFILHFLSYLFFPILIVFTFLTGLLTRLLGAGGKSPFTAREEIATVLEMPESEVDMEPVEKTMIRRMFNFSETTTYEIMIPLIDVVAVNMDANCGKAISIAVDKAHTRLPVYEKRVDRVIGVLNTLDLLGLEPEEPIKPYIRQVSYVPEYKSIKDLLRDLRKDGESVAIVVDEFGGAQGLVTIEDIMEEVVEEIEDEYDAEAQSKRWVRKISDREYIVSARIELDELEEELGIRLPECKSVTLAGFLLEKARDIPPTGTMIEYNGVAYTIQRATPQAIQEVRIRW
jgi:CBS domain containing-hemolysin-like protein